jgi:hypothetical protein
MLLGESAIVEYQNEMTVAGPDPQYRVTPTGRETPNIARAERVGRRSVRAQRGGAAIARNYVSQLGGIGVPVEFTQRTGPQTHRRAANALTDRELSDRRTPYETARVNARRLLS